MHTIAVIGAKGFVGSALCEALSTNTSFTVFPITRENSIEMRSMEFDTIINCAMPSARFRAKNDPHWDFTETIKKTADLVYDWKYKKFVQISSVSARCQLDTVYGRHKAAAEQLCFAENNLIIRLGPMYDKSLTKGVLVDMMHGKTVFIDESSRYCFASLAFSTQWIASHLHLTGIHEIGGRNAIALQDIAKHIGKDIVFDGPIDHQEIRNPEQDFPEASAVLAFLDNWKLRD